MIEKGLKGAQRTMAEGLKMSPMDRQIAEAGEIVKSIRKLQKNYDEIREYYKTLFTVVTEHNTSLAREIGEMLGYIQFQDVLRQRLERVAVAMAQRNDVLMELPRRLGEIEACSGICESGCFKKTGSQADMTELHAKMLGVLDEYLANEKLHASSGAGTAGHADGLPKMELF